MNVRKADPPIAFSTLACPEWSAAEVVDRAAALGFDLIEWRGGDEGHVSPALAQAARRELVDRMADRGVGALAVTSYTTFVAPDASVRDASVDHLRRHLDLAADLGAPYVRAFVGVIEDAAQPAELILRAVDGIAASADHAAALGLTVVLEPHDDFVHAERLVPLLRALDHPAVGAIWEIGNAWADGEHPSVGGPALARWIRYVQVKDGTGRGETWRLTRIGEGDVPLAEAIRFLAESDRPLPPLSIEWERAWHPELDPADVALEHGLRAVRRLLDVARA